MKKHLLKKTLAAVLSSAVMLTSTSGLPLSFAAINKSRVSVHDPSIIKVGDTYYVFGSHVDAAKSSDLQNWETFTNGYTTTNNVEFGNLSENLKKAFDWAGEDLGDCVNGFAIWAPDVVWNPNYNNADGSKGAYLMYFCTSSTWNTSVIGFASAKSIEGPYSFVDTLIYSGFTANDSYSVSTTKNVNRKYTSTNIDELIESGDVTFNNNWFSNEAYNYNVCPNAIDPTIYYDTDGKMYMVYGSWSGGIFTLEIDQSTGKCIHPKTGTTADGRMIDSYFGTKLIGGYHKSGEGPFIEYNAETGYYYLWVTYGGLLSNGGYNMRVFRSTNPTGPFTDAAGRTAIQTANSNLDSTGLKVMGNYTFSSLNTAYMACGHNSVLCDSDGQWYLFYHARFDDESEYHEVRVHKMFFNDDGWPVVTPFDYSGDNISDGGYDENDIVGEYEYINHGNSTDDTIISYQNIKLNADHTISGDVIGEWEQSQNSAAAIITIGTQRYSGYFIAAENEKGTKVMSFTAVGNNNQTIWGAKNTQFIGTERTTNIDYTDENSVLVISPDTVGENSMALRLSGTDLLSGVPYYITNKNSGMSLDLSSGKLDEGTNIQQWNINKLWAQQWKMIAVDDYYFRIVSVGDESKCIAVAENSADDGVNVELQTYLGTNNQLFSLVKCGSYYGIVSKCSNNKSGLDVFEWSKKNGGNINQFAFNEYDCQLWKIDAVHPSVPNGTYSFKNLNSGLFLSYNAESVVQGNAVGWNVSKQSDGTYTISCSESKSLTVENSNDVNGADITVSKPLGDSSQKFSIICNNDGSYSVLSAVSDNKKCLDVYNMSIDNGANVCQWEYWGGDGQKFILEPFADTVNDIVGDVNADGEFSVADLVMLQKFILGKEELTKWKNGDLHPDGIINVLDLIIIKQLILEKY